jgi:hypothetical protein
MATIVQPAAKGLPPLALLQKAPGAFNTGRRAVWTIAASNVTLLAWVRAKKSSFSGSK